MLHSKDGYGTTKLKWRNRVSLSFLTGFRKQAPFELFSDKKMKKQSIESQFFAGKKLLSIRKIRNGILIVDYAYCEILKTLRRTIQNTRCGKLISGVVNCCPHTAVTTQKLLTNFRYKQFHHTLYS